MLHGLFSSFKERGYSSCGMQVSHCGSFACGGAWTLGLKGFSSCGSRVLEHRLDSVELGLSCFAAGGILPNQGLNPGLLHWQIFHH